MTPLILCPVLVNFTHLTHGCPCNSIAAFLSDFTIATESFRRGEELMLLRHFGKLNSVKSEIKAPFIAPTQFLNATESQANMDILAGAYAEMSDVTVPVRDILIGKFDEAI
jgi:hypothetical protein